jgi:hypothetical protein
MLMYYLHTKCKVNQMDLLGEPFTFYTHKVVACGPNVFGKGDHTEADIIRHRICDVMYYVHTICKIYTAHSQPIHIVHRQGSCMWAERVR